jgi:hypothetical protein
MTVIDTFATHVTLMEYSFSLTWDERLSQQHFGCCTVNLRDADRLPLSVNPNFFSEHSCAGAMSRTPETRDHANITAKANPSSAIEKPIAHFLPATRELFLRRV